MGLSPTQCSICPQNPIVPNTEFTLKETMLQRNTNPLHLQSTRHETAKIVTNKILSEIQRNLQFIRHPGGTRSWRKNGTLRREESGCPWNRRLSSSTMRGSSSTATTALTPASSRRLVRFPVPGPISRTVSQAANGLS